MNSRKSPVRLRSSILALAALFVHQSAGAQDPTAVSGPIDIQANEQEFSGEQVIARGNVRVTYKDSVIIAPVATLFRDPAGSPQKAVFTGHPRLTQGTSNIDADTLTFEIALQKIVAEGNAHSEVISQGEAGGAQAAPVSPAAATAPKQASMAAGEKIITDSDRQEYDKSVDKFEAIGHVRVKHGDIKVNADKLQLVYGANKKPETAIFSGNVTATQGSNRTSADVITYSLSTRRLQASGHVKSQVIQKADAGIKAVPRNGPDLAAANGPDAAFAAQVKPVDDTVTITSDSQDYSQETGRLSAEGNVRVYYQDTVGIGPRVILVRNADGKAERVVFTGRSQVSQPGKRWIADRITVTVADKKVLAEGNTKALILQAPGKGPAPAPPASSSDSRLAGRGGGIN